jgi:hypothetical protein
VQREIEGRCRRSPEFVLSTVELAALRALSRQPGGGFFRVFERGGVREGGGFIATRGRRNRNEIVRINTRRSRSPRAKFSDEG